VAGCPALIGSANGTAIRDGVQYQPEDLSLALAKLEDSGCIVRFQRQMQPPRITGNGSKYYDDIDRLAADVSAAHGCFLDELREGRLAIEKHPQLDTAAKYAMSRQLAGGEALERRKPIVDTCPVLAAELAVWGVLHAVRSVPRIHVFKATEDGGW
jgi:hypothetical protein